LCLESEAGADAHYDMNKLSSGSDEEKNYDDLIGIPTPGGVPKKKKKK
jgi:hypothetical protein